MVLFSANKSCVQKSRPTKRAPDAGDSVATPGIFLRLVFFPVGRLRRPRPSAGNANRWAARCKKQNNADFAG